MEKEKDIHHTEKTQEEMVKEAVAKAGLELLEVTYQGEWVCVTARKNA